MTDGHVRFAEVQKARKWWLMAIILLPAALVWWGAIQQLVLGEPWGDEPAPDLMLAILLLTIGVALPGLLLNMRLTVEVTDTVSIRFFPFMPRPRRIRPEEIVRHQAMKYSPLSDYGGWGIKGWSSDRAYSVDGDQGVKIWLSDGRAVMIGSREPEALNMAIGTLVKTVQTRMR